MNPCSYIQRQEPISYYVSIIFHNPLQVEDCDENFVKECHIEYENKAFDEQVEICNERPIRDCQGKGKNIIAIMKI